MYSRGSPISYTSCSVTPATSIRPPVPGCLMRSNVPSARASPIGEPTFARSGIDFQSLRQLPPEHWAPHSMTWPATVPAAMRSHASAAHPNPRISGPPARAEAAEAPEEVVAVHDPDPQLTRESDLARDLSDGIGAGLGIHAARVRRDLDAPLDDRGQDAFHLRDEIGRVATLRITRFLFLEDGHRHFGQIVHHQVVDRAAGHLAVRCLQPISPKALPTRDTNRRRSCAHWPLPPVAPRAAAVSVVRRAATLPPAPVTRVSMRAANPSGRSSDGGFGNFTIVLPPGTTVTARPSPVGSSGPR